MQMMVLFTVMCLSLPHVFVHVQTGSIKKIEIEVVLSGCIAQQGEYNDNNKIVSIYKENKRKLMQGINVAEKDCTDLFVNTHVCLNFISLNIHIIFSLRTNSRVFEIPDTNFRISFGQDFVFFVFHIICR